MSGYNLTRFRKHGCHHHGWHRCDCVVVAMGGVRGGKGQNFHTFCECHQEEAAVNCILVVVVQQRGKLIDRAGAGGGHGHFCCGLRILLWLCLHSLEYQSVAF